MPDTSEKPSPKLVLTEDGELPEIAQKKLNDKELLEALIYAKYSNNFDIQALYQALLEECIRYAELCGIEQRYDAYGRRKTFGKLSLAALIRGETELESYFYLLAWPVALSVLLGIYAQPGQEVPLNEATQILAPWLVIPLLIWIISNAVYPYLDFQDEKANELLNQDGQQSYFSDWTLREALYLSKNQATNLLTLLLREQGEFRPLIESQKFLRQFGEEELQRRSKAVQEEEQRLKEEQEAQRLQEEKEAERKLREARDERRENELEALRQEVLKDQNRKDES